MDTSLQYTGIQNFAAKIQLLQELGGHSDFTTVPPAKSINIFDCSLTTR